MMTPFLKTKHNQGVHGSVTLALTRPDPLILVTSVWLEHVGNQSGAYSHVSPSSDFIMKCLKWWGGHLCWLTRDSSCNLHFISRDAPTHGLMPIKGFPVAGSGHGHKWSLWTCALIETDVEWNEESRDKRKPINVRRWSTPETCLVAVTLLPGNVKP